MEQINSNDMNISNEFGLPTFDGNSDACDRPISHIAGHFGHTRLIPFTLAASFI